LTWTSASTEIIVEFAGHIAVGLDPLNAGIGYGVGLGAASISGGPYHIPLEQLDGASTGSQDNQLKGADIKIPPAITCPPNQTNTCAPPQGANVTYPAPTVVGGKTPIATNCTPASGSLFPIGTTTVTCTVTDAEGLSDTCSFTVTVTEKPSCSITLTTAPVGAGQPETFNGPAGMAS